MNILCLSTDKWDGRWKRKQIIMKELSEYPGVDNIYYINPPRYKNLLFKKHKYNEKITIFEISRLLFMLPKIYYFMLMILYKLFSSSKGKEIKNIIWLYGIQKTDLYVTKKLKNKGWKFIYDWTDDWSYITSIRNSNEIYEDILTDSDLVFTVSEKLYVKAKQKNNSVYRMPNGTYPANELTLDSTVPEWFNSSKKIVGYVGQITNRLDISIIKDILFRDNNCLLVLVGPIMEAEVEQELITLKNEYSEKLVLTGQVEHIEAISFTQFFDICIIPHIVNELTLSMDPIKLYDYLALGKPVVTTKVGGVDKFRDTIFITDNKHFSEVIEKINTKEGKDKKEQRIQVAINNSWNKRVKEIYNHIIKL